MEKLIEFLKDYDSLRAVTADLDGETKIPESDLEDIQTFHKDHFKIYGVKDSQVISEQVEEMRSSGYEHKASDIVFCYEKGRIAKIIRYLDSSTALIDLGFPRESKTSTSESEPILGMVYKDD